MSGVKLTKAREEVLRAVASRDIQRRLLGNEERDIKRTWYHPGRRPPQYDAAVAFLEQAGLIELTRDEDLRRIWKLTEAGEKWLAEHEEGNR